MYSSLPGTNQKTISRKPKPPVSFLFQVPVEERKGVNFFFVENISI
jgi:hypothetical protein